MKHKRLGRGMLVTGAGAILGAYLSIGADGCVPGSLVSCGSLGPAYHDMAVQDPLLRELSQLLTPTPEPIIKPPVEEPTIVPTLYPTQEPTVEPTAVPTPSELEQLASYACANLPRAVDDLSTERDESTLMSLYKVFSNGDGTFRYEEISRVPANPAGYQFVIPSGQHDYWIVARAGSGIDVTSMYSGIGGVNPPNCLDAMILPKNIPREVFSIESLGNLNITAIVRAE